MNVHLSRSLNVHAHSGQSTKTMLVLICAAGAKKGASRAVRAFAWLRGGWRDEVWEQNSVCARADNNASRQARCASSSSIERIDR
jgi:hypothetical protein